MGDSGRLCSGEEALAEIVVTAALLHHVKSVNLMRQTVLAFLAKRCRELSYEVWPFGTYQRRLVGLHRQRQ